MTWRDWLWIRPSSDALAEARAEIDELRKEKRRLREMVQARDWLLRQLVDERRGNDDDRARSAHRPVAGPAQ
jgi:hypothetical protein